MRKFWALYVSLPTILLTLFISVVLAAQTAAAPGIVYETQPVRFEATANSLDPNVAFELANATRVQAGGEALIAHADLGRLAQARANDMAARNYYAHKTPDGAYYYDYFEEYGIQAGYSCENLDLVFVSSVEMVVSEWQASLKGHRECMMSQKTSMAGYGSAAIELVNFDGKTTTAYIVVAIHAQIPLF